MMATIHMVAKITPSGKDELSLDALPERFFNTETRRTQRKVRGFTEKILSKSYLFLLRALCVSVVKFFQEIHLRATSRPRA